MTSLTSIDGVYAVLTLAKLETKSRVLCTLVNVGHGTAAVALRVVIVDEVIRLCNGTRNRDSRFCIDTNIGVCFIFEFSIIVALNSTN